MNRGLRPHEFTHPKVHPPIFSIPLETSSLLDTHKNEGYSPEEVCQSLR